MRARRAYRALKKVSAFAFFWGGGMAVSWLLLPLITAAPGDPERHRRRVRRMVQVAFVAFHDYMRTLRLVDYDPRKTRLEVPDGPYVMIANHPTLVDVTAIMAVRPELACVVKQEHFEGGMVGRLLRLCGHINGGDGSPFASAAVVLQALDRLAAGQPVLIFPEGTRSPVRDLGTFHRGAFEAARRAGVPVVPVLVTCNPPTLMKGEPWHQHPDEPAVLDVQPFDDLRPSDLEGTSAEVAAGVEARYRERIETFWAAARAPLVPGEGDAASEQER
jgi:1-acyl-sn-glycerol-3-phosphate acyltransferase